MNLPTENDLRGYLSSLSNWNRWGEGVDGLMGTLNLIDSKHAVAGAGSRIGRVIACGLPVSFAPAGAGRDPAGHIVRGETEFPIHYMIGYEQLADDIGERPGVRAAAHDGLLIESHGRVITHLDAPAHTVLEGSIFNGIPAEEALGPEGASIGGIGLASGGIVTRGVMLDVAAARGVRWLEDTDFILPGDLERCERLQGVTVGKGDCLLVRTGYRAKSLTGSPKGPGYARPGLQAACLPWLRERDVAMVGADVPVDCFPFGYDLGHPIHTVGMWAMGLWLLDNCYLEPLSSECESLGQYSFLFVVSPLDLGRATSSPVNPLAIF